MEKKRPAAENTWSQNSEYSLWPIGGRLSYSERRSHGGAWRHTCAAQLVFGLSCPQIVLSVLLVRLYCGSNSLFDFWKIDCDFFIFQSIPFLLQEEKVLGGVKFWKMSIHSKHMFWSLPSWGKIMHDLHVNKINIGKEERANDLLSEQPIRFYCNILRSTKISRWLQSKHASHKTV